MLHFETVEPGTLSLLKKLMKLPSLKGFSLVGGTALALRYGHRSSDDLDLFFHEKFDHQIILDELRNEFGENIHIESGHQKIGIFCYIDNIKVDIVYTPFLPIASVESRQSIRIYSSADIAAMKIQAILGRAKKKDFWDLHELLKHFSLEQIIEWHKKKYPGQLLAISIPNAITYFIEANNSETPKSYKNQTWESVKKGISKAVSDYLS